MKLRKRSTVAQVVAFTSVILPTLWAVEARAATFTVNSNADNGANCTLRLAVAAANGGTNACGHGTANGDTVQLGGPNATSVTLSAANGAIIVTSNMTIQGNFNNQHQNFTDAVVSVTTGGRIFQVQSGGLTVKYLRLTGANDLDVNGGAISIYPDGGATLDTVQIDHCTAWLGGGVSAGGGLLSVSNSSLHDNHAAMGGAIYDTGAGMNVTRTTFTNNRGDQNPGGEYGGAIYIGSLIDVDRNIDASTFSLNQATYGGGLAVFNRIMLTGSTFESNLANASGGGAYVGATFQMANCTFTGNSANDGGGIYRDASQYTGGLYWIDDQNTIVFNHANGLGGGVDISDQDWGSPPGQGDIIWGNTAGVAGPDVFAVFRPVSTCGHNLIGDMSGVPNAPSDCISQNPLLGTYAAINQGPKCYPLLPGNPLVPSNPAIDAAPALIGGVGTIIDQRGFPRPIDGNLDGNALWDLGSYEYDPPRETELLTVAAKSSDTHSIVTDGTYSHGQGTWLHANATNDFVAYSVPVLVAGTYAITVRAQRANDRGRVQLATATTVNGTYTNRGSAQDFYSSSTNFVSPSLGTVTFTSSGPKFFRFTVTGKNNSSSGFNVRLDNITLTEQ